MNPAPSVIQTKRKWIEVTALSRDAVMIFYEMTERLQGTLPEDSPVYSACTSLQQTLEALTTSLFKLEGKYYQFLQDKSSLQIAWQNIALRAAQHSGQILDLAEKLTEGSAPSMLLQQYGQKIDRMYRELEIISGGLFRPAPQA